VKNLSCTMAHLHIRASMVEPPRCATAIILASAGCPTSTRSASLPTSTFSWMFLLWVTLIKSPTFRRCLIKPERRVPTSTFFLNVLVIRKSNKVSRLFVDVLLNSNR
jgi:hypothetical protein